MDDLRDGLGPRLSRRRLMQSAAVVSIGLVASACGEGESSTAEQPTSPPGDTGGRAAALQGERVEVWRDPG